VHRDVIDSVSTALEAHRLLVRGGFNFAAAAQAPPALSDSPARAVILVGNAGAATAAKGEATAAHQVAGLIALLRQVVDMPLDGFEPLA